MATEGMLVYCSEFSKNAHDRAAEITIDGD